MKILLVSYRYDYDNHWRRTKRELNDNYLRWYATLERIASRRKHVVLPFWTDAVIVEKGRVGMNDALRKLVFEEKPDVGLFYGCEHDLDKSVLAEIKGQSPMTTVYICGDDAWSFDSLSKHSAPYFSWIMTWCFGMREKYLSIGCKNVIEGQVGVDLEASHIVPGEKSIDVSFVGGWSKPRAEIVNALRRAGIDVFVRGNGWPEGSVSQEEMNRIFSHSKIVLSMNPPAFHVGLTSIARLFFRRAYLGEEGPSIKLDVHHAITNARSWWQKRRVDIKARHFEVPACGTMQITKYAENLESYYEPGKEIVFYTDIPDLVKKIKYYLSHPAEREAIAGRAYKRTLREHTAEKRLYDMFATIGLPL